MEGRWRVARIDSAAEGPSRGERTVVVEDEAACDCEGEGATSCSHGVAGAGRARTSAWGRLEFQGSSWEEQDIRWGASVDKVMANLAGLLGVLH